MMKNGFERVKPECLDNDHHPFKHWGLALHNRKGLCQITEAVSLENCQEQQQIKWIAYLNRSENNNIIKILQFVASCVISDSPC